MKYAVGDTVRVEGDNDVWDGTIAVVEEIDTTWTEFPYVIRVRSSPRPHTAGEKFNWNEETLVPHDTARVKLDRVIEGNFPRRIDVFYSQTSGGAVVLGDNGKLYRILADGTVDLP